MKETAKTIVAVVLFVLALLFFLYAIIFDPLAPAPVPTSKPSPTPVTRSFVMPAETAEPQDYVLNTNTMRFHYPDCRSVPEISQRNREDVFASRDELLDRGFKSCGNCRP